MSLRCGRLLSELAALPVCIRWRTEPISFEGKTVNKGELTTLYGATQRCRRRQGKYVKGVMPGGEI